MVFIDRVACAEILGFFGIIASTDRIRLLGKALNYNKEWNAYGRTLVEFIRGDRVLSEAQRQDFRNDVVKTILDARSNHELGEPPTK